MSATACRHLLLLLLCLTSGIVDVIGYLGLGHIFTANMTGNIVMLGLAIGHVQGLAVLRTLTALLGFIMGNALGASIIRKKKVNSPWPPTLTIILGIELLLFILFKIISGPTASDSTIYLLIALLSIAMGMQTTAARSLAIAGISTTVLTNNLANVVEDVTDILRKWRTLGIHPKHLAMDSILRAAAIVLYGLGAVLAAFVEQQFPFTVIWIPVCIMGGIILTALIRFRPSRSNQN
ncbi:hypothetical protein BC351_12310 [Paenibacillus ferrarius]|uniref:DUF1275 family protein n=1 Tax=Paenibacillus ferrarius TaxID=1469647 RepID=A0A1V4H818_9BACL|nr:YoaK family protein [Paenibacillus ferrarius]OPH47274.1 hypothetical protein BC351_12310 [Paenibacillus ferrarius]